MGLNSISKKMAKSKLEQKPIDNSSASTDSKFYDAKDDGGTSNIDTPKTLADRFAGDKNLIRLTPAQKKMYRKEGYTDVNDYKTILAPGTIFRPGYKAMYESDKATDKPKLESGIGTVDSKADNKFNGAADASLQHNFDFSHRYDWATQNPDAKPITTKQAAKGSLKNKTQVFVQPDYSKTNGGVENNPNPTIKTPVKTSVNTQQQMSKIDAIKEYHDAVSSATSFTPQLEASSKARIAAAKKKLDDMKIDMDEVMQNATNNSPVPSANEVNKGFHPIDWFKSKMQYAMDETNKFNRGQDNAPAPGLFSKSKKK